MSFQENICLFAIYSFFARDSLKSWLKKNGSQTSSTIQRMLKKTPTRTSEYEIQQVFDFSHAILPDCESYNDFLFRVRKVDTPSVSYRIVKSSIHNFYTELHLLSVELNNKWVFRLSLWKWLRIIPSSKYIISVSWRIGDIIEYLDDIFTSFLQRVVESSKKQTFDWKVKIVYTLLL